MAAPKAEAAVAARGACRVRGELTHLDGEVDFSARFEVSVVHRERGGVSRGLHESESRAIPRPARHDVLTVPRVAPRESHVLALVEHVHQLMRHVRQRVFREHVDADVAVRTVCANAHIQPHPIDIRLLKLCGGE